MLGDKPDSQDGGAPKVLLVTINIVMVTIVIVNIISRANIFIVQITVNMSWWLISST